jgi:hypothetical protein
MDFKSIKNCKVLTTQHDEKGKSRILRFYSLDTREPYTVKDGNDSTDIPSLSPASNGLARICAPRLACKVLYSMKKGTDIRITVFLEAIERIIR